MVATPTPDLRLKKPASGDDVNTWWSDLNTNFDLLDFAITGWTDVALSGNISLSSNNYVADQARSAALHFTGTGAFTVTAPGVAKTYVVWNACTGVTTITNGSSSIAIQVGEVCLVATDGASNFVRVAPSIFPNPVTFGSTASFGGAVDLGGHQAVNAADPTTAQGLATRAYADALAFAANAGILPGQGGNANGILTTDGATPTWRQRSISAGVGLSGGGNIGAASQALALDINGLTALGAAPVPANDTVALYSASGAVIRKVALTSLNLPYQLIGTNTISGSPATVVFAAIPQTFANLLLVFNQVSHNAGAPANINLALSSNGGSTYTGTAPLLLAGTGFNSGLARITDYTFLFPSIEVVMLSGPSAAPAVAAVTPLGPYLASLAAGCNNLKLSVAGSTFQAGTITLYGI